MRDEEQPDTAHAFERANDLLGEHDGIERLIELSGRDRRGQTSIAEGLGSISTGHDSAS